MYPTSLQYKSKLNYGITKKKKKKRMNCTIWHIFQYQNVVYLLVLFLFLLFFQKEITNHFRFILIYFKNEPDKRTKVEYLTHFNTFSINLIKTSKFIKNIIRQRLLIRVYQAKKKCGHHLYRLFYFDLYFFKSVLFLRFF